MIDILLVVPPYYYKTKVLVSSAKEYAGVGFLAAILRENGYTVKILDADLAGFGIDETVEATLKELAPVIGFTALQVAAHSALQIIHKLRASGVDAHITLGGHFPTFAAEEMFQECPGISSIVMGEGDYTFLELVKALDQGKDWRTIEGIAYPDDGQVVINPPRPLIKDLDVLPFQSRDTLPEVMKRGGPAAIITSRGCYGNCSFCSVNAFYRRSPGKVWRGRSPGNIADELEELVRRYGTRIFVFNDDNFIGPGQRGKERAYEIGEEILRRGIEIQYAIPAAVNDVDRDLFSFLKKSGLRSVFLGIESMLQRHLDLLNKHTTVEQNERAIRLLEEIGIFYQVGFILFYPESTLEEVKYNLRYVLNRILKNDYCGTQVFTGDLRVLRGTALERSYNEKNVIRKERFHYTYAAKDDRVEQLRTLMDQLIMKKTFPMMVECKEDFMASGWHRWLRTLIGEIQMSVSLDVIEHLEKGRFGSEEIKKTIRDLNNGIQTIHQEIAAKGLGENEQSANPV